MLFVGLFWGVGHSAEYYVTPTGGGTKDGSSWANADDSIQDGINAVSAGEALYIGGGTYTLVATLTSHSSGSSGNMITWTASDDPVYGGGVTLDCDDFIKRAIVITHDYIKLTGTSNSPFKITNGTDNEHWIAYLWVDGGNYGELSFLEIYNTDYNSSTIENGGIYLQNANYARISDCTLHYLGGGSCDSGAYGGVTLKDSDHNEIYDNTIYEVYNGISLQSGCDNNEFYYNTIYDNWNLGIGTDGSGTANTNNKAYDNTIYDCESGNINIWRITTPDDTGWEVYGNLLYFTRSTRMPMGIYLDHVENSYFFNNVIYDGGYNTDFGCPANNTDFRGIRLDQDADNNHFYNNTVYSWATGDARAFWLFSGALGSTFRNNVAFVNSPSGYAVYQEGSDSEAFDYNCWYVPNNSSHFYYGGSDRSWIYWTGTLGRDPNGYNDDPDFKNIGFLPNAADRTNDGLTPDLGANSRLIDNGVDLSRTFADDFLGHPRDASYDIGAYEYAPVGGGGGAGGGGGGGGGCFITKSAYQSALSIEVHISKPFRDAYLLDSKFGGGVISTYHKYSPGQLTSLPTIR
jgi:parallel beta-helix repeat protein